MYKLQISDTMSSNGCKQTNIVKHCYKELGYTKTLLIQLHVLEGNFAGPSSL